MMTPSLATQTIFFLTCIYNNEKIKKRIKKLLFCVQA